MDTLNVILLYFAIVFALFAIAFVAAMPFGVAQYLINKGECSAVGAQMSIPHSYGMFAGCMIEPKPGKWIQLEQYHQISE